MKHVNGKRRKESITLDGNPSLLTAKNIKAEWGVYLYNCPSLLELSTTVEGKEIYVSFNLRQ